jgi:hypothetical protein
LWKNPANLQAWEHQEPLPSSLISDLGLRQIIKHLQADQQSQWVVEDMLCRPCTSEEEIEYRLEIMDDLMKCDGLFILFSDLIFLVDKLQSLDKDEAGIEDPIRQASCFLQKSILYTKIITALQEGLQRYKENINSEGLQLLTGIVSQIANSSTFGSMVQDIAKLEDEAKEINQVDICFNCKNEMITSFTVDVRPAENQERLLARLIKLVQPIIPLAADEYADVNQGSDFSQLEELVLEEKRKAYPEHFSALIAFRNKYKEFPLDHVLPYGSELRFYTAMITMIKKLKTYGFGFCKPRVMAKNKKHFSLRRAYDLGLALRMVEDDYGADCMVCNDHKADDAERVFILTGPNQGGKTTFIRSIGISQIMFQAGCFVPAADAELSPVDHVFTHFPEKEVLGEKKGRLAEEAGRIARIFTEATEYSLVMLNESFSSVRRADGYILGKDVLKAMMKLGCHGIFVTHITELAHDAELFNQKIQNGSQVVNLQAGVIDPDGIGMQGKRTYEIKRVNTPFSFSYARDIAQKCGLTFEQLVHLFETRGLVEGGIKK